MAYNNLSQKLRFLPYLPYGFCSKISTSIEGMDNPYATSLLLGDDPNTMIDLCERHHKKALDRARYLCEKHLVKEIKRTCGTPSIERSFRCITKLGLAVLIDPPTFALNAGAGCQNNSTTTKGHFRSEALAASNQRELLYDYATSDQDSDVAAFEDALSEAVMNGLVTPLTAAIAQVQDTTTSPNKYGQNQRYHVWQVSHIMAMFRANRHLTFIDRRQYDTNHSIDGIKTDADYNSYIQKHGHTVASISYYALSRWYRNNPGYYLFGQSQPNETAEAREFWLHMPAFYTTQELPVFDGGYHSSANNAHNAKVSNSVHIGLATGCKVNYICYHAKPGKFVWVQKRESMAQKATELAIRHMKAKSPDLICNNNVDYALYFCTSYHQFLSIFERTVMK